MAVSQRVPVGNGMGIPLHLAIKPGGGDDAPTLLDDPSMGILWGRSEDVEAIRRRLPAVRMQRGHKLDAIGEDSGDGVRGERMRLHARELGVVRPPDWLMGTYRPRALTPVGYMALECMAPGGPGLRPYPLRPLESLAMRRDMLAVRYVALDMVARGNAFEVNGSYHHVSDAHRRKWLEADALLSMVRSDEHIDEMELLLWLAVGRKMSTDQVLSIDPDNAYNNFTLLREMKDRGIVDAHDVVMGEGTLQVWYLTVRGWNGLCRHYMDLPDRGFGPMRKHASTRNTGLYELHQSLQVDAIMWFTHMVEDGGGIVSDIWLQRALAADGGVVPSGRLLDFRLAHEDRRGLSAVFDVEVVGTGNPYRSSGSKNFIRKSPTHCSFSGASSSVEMGRHVTVGR